ncbi:hypothetical protein E2562_033890 [Oryza meyeriana var. granulata]|uniref:Prohibitin n=1 Tax=Oryza meyeriana var. granulata TaxID=110450 RepID=A0A6G1BNG3_9ORYZ|nr:hypothetical protein E2562_033890 [Oryza meyeriana var. granulata]
MAILPWCSVTSRLWVARPPGYSPLPAGDAARSRRRPLCVALLLASAAVILAVAVLSGARLVTADLPEEQHWNVGQIYQKNDEHPGARSTASTALYTVDCGQRAVIFDRFRGVLPETSSEGTYFIVPWLQKPYVFDIRTRPNSFSSTSRTKDLQMVSLTLRVLARPDYDEKVLLSIGNEVLKAVVAQFNGDQLLTERPHVSALVRDSLVRRAREFNIVLDDVAITHLAYGPDFSQAVEKKQVTQQEAERSRFLVARTEQER